MTNRKSIAIGDRFARLKVIEKVETKPGEHRRFVVKCDCGKTKNVLGTNLVRGLTRSCGCLHRKHDVPLKSLPEYRVWNGMKDRCENPSNDRYERYGGRGIKVIFGSFEDFLKEVGPRPSDSYTIDRFPNNDGNYEPGNVRWATVADQNRNTSRNKYVYVHGKKMTISEAARCIGMDVSTFKRRIAKGISVEGVST